MQKEVRRSWLELHLAVLLWGFTAILGKVIALPAISIVWWRVLLTSLGLLLLVKIGRIFKSMDRKHLLIFSGIGVLVALHWLCFYGSIKLANASIALVCMATASFFTSLLEPWLLGYKARLHELVLGVLIIPGMVFVFQGVDMAYYEGIVVGLLAAFLAALFGTLNKKYLARHAPIHITYIEIVSSTLFLSILLILSGSLGEFPAMKPGSMDIFYLLLLAFACTILPFTISLRALRHISAFGSALTINLEPVYGIILAWLILKEHHELNTSFYLGVVVIISTIFINPFVHRKYVGSKKR